MKELENLKVGTTVGKRGEWYFRAIAETSGKRSISLTKNIFFIFIFKFFLFFFSLYFFLKKEKKRKKYNHGSIVIINFNFFKS
jgi:hypothetical protein